MTFTINSYLFDAAGSGSEALHDSDNIGSRTYQRSYNVQLIDPCFSTVLTPSISTIHLHTLIGSENLFHSFSDYTDTISSLYDTDSSAQGYVTCGLREHTLVKNNLDHTGEILSQEA